MSTALGIASVTHVLKDLLNDGIINNNVATAVGTVVGVSSLSPGHVEINSGATPTQLNMFLYRVSTNTGWSNLGYPSRNGRGEIVNNPPLALNLHYLLTAFGEKELHAEILLGYGMQILHENPILPRAAIRNSLSAATAEDTGGRLPDNLQALATSELAEQIEQIKITPDPINSEEISKLWTAFQTKYRPCSAYQATVVLIESSRSTNSPLPVQKRKFYPILLRQPTIEKILSQTVEDGPMLSDKRIIVGTRLVIQGHQLKRDSIAVLINGEVIIEVMNTNEPFPTGSLMLEISDTQFIMEIPDNLKAGVLGVQIAHLIEMENEPVSRRGTESNLLSFVLSPSISNINVNIITATGEDVLEAELTLNVTPGVHRGQRIILLLNKVNLSTGEKSKSYSFILPTDVLVDEDNAVPTITFPVSNIEEGDYLVRIQVDGAESPLDTNTQGEYDEPQVNIS